MSSPDGIMYNSLLLYDRDPYSIVKAAILDAQSKFSAFNPAVGSLELALLDSLSLIASELVFAINRQPDQIMHDVMSTFGIARDLGTPPDVNINLNTIDSTGWEFPAGLVFRMYDGAGNSIDFETTAPASVPVNVSFALIPATATTNTDIFNGIAGGAALTVITPTSGISFALTQNAVSGGASPETDNEWRDRAAQKIAGLSAVCVLPEHFTLKALENASVYRAYTRDNWNVTVSATGHVTVGVADSAGGPLSTQQMSDLEDELESFALASLTVHVVEPNWNVIDTETIVTAKSGYSQAAVEDAISDMLFEYLSAKTWDWGDTVRINELISKVDQIEGVDYVESVEATIAGGTMGPTDVTLVGPLPLVRSGSHTITVNLP